MEKRLEESILEKSHTTENQEDYEITLKTSEGYATYFVSEDNPILKEFLDSIAVHFDKCAKPKY